MMDDRDYRIRCFEHHLDFGVATGLHNQLENIRDKAIPINEGAANQELTKNEVENHYDVVADMNFDPKNKGIATGSLNHMKAALKKAESGWCEMERCGHRLGIRCNVTERYEVEQ